MKDAVSYEAVFEDGSVQKLRVLGADEDTDVALLSVKDTAKRPVLALSDDKPSARHGERSFAIGYPLKDGKIITEGIVNAPTAEVNDVIRLLTSAQVSPGMSGAIAQRRRAYHRTHLRLVCTMNGIHICVTVEDIRKL